MSDNDDNKPKIEFWDCGESDTLTHTTMEEAMEEYLDAIEPDLWPKTLNVRGYARQVVTDKAKKYLAARMLDMLLEDLDEAYGGGDDWSDPTTDKMQAAAAAFVNAVVSEYQVWRCEPVVTETVDVSEWVKDHRPEWIGEVTE